MARNTGTFTTREFARLFVSRSSIKQVFPNVWLVVLQVMFFPLSHAFSNARDRTPPRLSPTIRTKVERTLNNVETTVRRAPMRKDTDQAQHNSDDGSQYGRSSSGRLQLQPMW